MKKIILIGFLMLLIACSNNSSKNRLKAKLYGGYPQKGVLTVKLFAYDKRRIDRDALLLTTKNFKVATNPMEISLEVTENMREKLKEYDWEHLEFYITPFIDSGSYIYMADFEGDGLPVVDLKRSHRIDMVFLGREER